ncbi:MAG: transcriptional regulator [Rhizobiaceae bacterium]|nr:transcriptional regulator [Rhizobiaceae bacterium]
MATEPLNLVEEAIRLAGGSERRLAERVGVSQAAINKAKQRVATGGRVSAELADKIDKAGLLPRHLFRPDLFEAPPPKTEAA